MPLVQVPVLVWALAMARVWAEPLAQRCWSYTPTSSARNDDGSKGEAR